MLDNTKDSIANITTMAGAGAGLLDYNAFLTLGLIVTGIILNLYRIREIRRSKKKKD
jgi:hypothetical protein